MNKNNINHNPGLKVDPHYWSKLDKYGEYVESVSVPDYHTFSFVQYSEESEPDVDFNIYTKEGVKLAKLRFYRYGPVQDKYKISYILKKIYEPNYVGECYLHLPSLKLTRKNYHVFNIDLTQLTVETLYDNVTRLFLLQLPKYVI